VRTFVIGDVHGSWRRADALLLRANPGDDDAVVFLGDLGDFRGNEVADTAAYQLAADIHADVLWGNHDRAAIDEHRHSFGGFERPSAQLLAAMEKVRMCRALASVNGYLLTHAGVHPEVAKLALEAGVDVTSAVAFADWLQSLPGDHPAMCYIGFHRGGLDPFGGILWRDDSEPLFMGVPQVYGHSRGDIRARVPASETQPWSFCIDVGSKNNGNLAGMWLPGPGETVGKVVAIGPDAEEFEGQYTIVRAGEVE
jgi:predicted phosphodiesterase